MKLLSKKEPQKNLLLYLKKMGGRSSSGRVTVRHRGGGVKRLYRIVDFGQEKIDVPGKVIALEYDPNRTSFLALVEYPGGENRYIIAPVGLKAGDPVICSEKTEIKAGNRTRLKNIPIGAAVFNVELELNRGGVLIRSAGTAAKIIAQEDGFTNLEMPSGETRKISWDCFASIGQVSHPEKRFEKLGKAGKRRLMGWRPTVRGKAMTPIDHPHGGGKGKSPIGLKYPKTPTGKHALGVKTRQKKWADKYIIKRRKS